MILRAFALFCGIMFSQVGFGSQITEDFTSRSHLDFATAVWNQALGKVHPTLQVASYNGAAAAIDFSVGDGSDGAFDVSTYASFSQGGDVSGNIIRLDTSAHPLLQVTHFYLAPGWSIQPVGNNQIIIESLSYVDIQGEIWCQGYDGGDASGSSAGSGGQGRCGGTAGGAGGPVASGGSVGSTVSVSPAVTGGKGGSFSGTAVGGGGGGSWNTTISAGNGPNSSGANGQGGSSYSDPSFQNLNGASGGGGGSGDATDAGGGGGGGGGLVMIFAVGDVSIGTSPSSSTGFIYVNGGKGGNGSGSAAPGGGGGGGSVRIAAGGTIHIYNTNGSGAVQALGGAAGTNGASVTGAVGAGGRAWLSANAYDYVGSYNPTEQSPISPGQVQYTSTMEYVDTVSFDLGDNTAEILSMAVLPSSSDFTILVGGSDDNFVSDDTGFTTSVATVSHKRYIRMEIQIQSTTPTSISSGQVSQAQVSYTGGLSLITDFKFQAAGCGRVDNVATPKTNLLLLLLTPILVLLHKVRVTLRSGRRTTKC